MKYLKLYLLLVTLISACPYACAQTKDNNAATVASSPEPKKDFLRDTSIYSVLSRLPRLGADFVLLFWDPKGFTKRWINSPQTRVSSKEALAWTLGLIFILYGLYGLVFRASPLDRFVVASDKEDTQNQKSLTKSNPKIARITFSRKFISRSVDGATQRQGEDYALSPLPSIEFPESKRIDQPQLMVLTTGIVYVYVTDMVPGVFGSKKAQTVLVFLYSLIAVICIHPVAHLLGASVAFRESFELTIVLFSFFLMFMALLSLILVLLFSDLLKVNLTFESTNPKMFKKMFIGSCLWATFIFGALIRSFLLSYKLLYGFSFWRLVCALLGGIAISSIVCPIIFIPSLYGFLKLRKIIELFS